MNPSVHRKFRPADGLAAILNPVLKPYRKVYYSLPLLGTLALLAGLIAPAVQKSFIDGITHNNNAVWLWLAISLLCAGVTAAAASMIRYLDGWLTAQVLTGLKSALVARLLELPGDFFSRHASGYLAARIDLDTVRMGYFYSNLRWRLPLSVLQMAIALAVLFLVQWKLALALTAITPFYYWLLRKFRRRNYKLNRENGEMRAASWGALRGIIGNIRTVKTHVREHAAHSEIKVYYHRLLGLNLQMLRLNLFLEGIMRTIPATVKLSILIWGIFAIRQGGWSLGELWALLGYAAMVLTPTLAVATLLMEREAARSAADRVVDLSRRLPEMNQAQGIVPDHLKGAVEFVRLSFGYRAGQTVIAGLSARIAPGETVGVIGSSGSGKSTLMGLLLQLYRPWQGEIRFDGIAADQYNIRALRRRIGYVGQSPQFFAGTLAQNLSDSASEAECRAALCAVGAPELRSRLNEPVLEDGNNFSAGEKIRIAVARELLRQTDIVILDEPTASLDPVHEAELMRMCATALAGKTVFLITHKYELQSGCSQIIELGNGQGCDEQSPQ